MKADFEILVDGQPIPARAGWSVAAAARNAGRPSLRTSVTGEARGPLCGMGVCFECRVSVDGVAHVRACLEPCRPGMRVETGAP